MNTFSIRSFLTFLSRNKLFTAINIFGFSVSLMFVVLLSLYINEELKVDRFHEKKDRIFRLQTDGSGNFSAPIAQDLINRYPEIEALTRIGNLDYTVTRGTEKINAESITVDSSFFDIFSFPLVEGDRSQLFRTKSDVVLMESFARKLFGNESAVGKTIQLEDTLHYTISGVVRDFTDTHFDKTDMLVRFDNQHKNYLERYNSCNFHIYLLTRPNTDFHSKMEDCIEYFKTYFWLFQDNFVEDLYLEPLEQCYFNTEMSWSGRFRTNSKQFIWILAITMLTILFFAVINYINLSVAQTGFRAKEAAIRRLLGGTKGGLFRNFIIESTLLCFVSFLIALILARMVQPVFNKLLITDISIADSLTLANLLIAALFVILLGAVSGLVPASVIAQFKPIEVVRGTFKRKTKMVYSRILICFQYCITIVLIGCTFFIIRQTNFMRSYDVGFNKENIIQMNNTLNMGQEEGLRSLLMQINGVEAVSFSAGTPINGGNNQSVAYPDREPISFQTFMADSFFFKVYGIEIVRETGIRADTAMWLNESAFKELGLTEEDDMFMFYSRLPIAGIVKDFHFRSLNQEVGPAILGKIHPRQWPWNISVRISGNPTEIYKQVVSAYSQYNGGEPFNSFFADEKLNSWYDEQERTSKIIGYFSILAIIISALGMLAMSTYFMRQRAVEIAIRKVFGSTDVEILKKLVMSFMKLVIIAFIIAIPIIWYIMSEWLKDYPYRISLSWTIFALAGLTALSIAFVAVFWQTLKATRANPVNSIKD